MRKRLYHRRERWGLTFQGWLWAVGLLALVTIGLVSQLYSFFAINAPIVDAQAVVIEGWVTDDNLEDALAEFRSRPTYEYLVVTGGTLSRGHYLKEYKTFAELGKATLLKMGVPESKLIAVPSPIVKRDRTYTSAVSLRDWLDQHPGQIKTANLISTGVHARRSWTLFQKALGNRIGLGVVAAPDRDFNPDRWWASSEGTKRIIFEIVGYFYVKIFSVVE